jgi:hypothetical protein
MGVEAGGGSELVGDYSTSSIFGGEVRHVAASLVTVGAQIAIAAIESRTTGNCGHRGSGFQSEVSLGVGGMDLVAGAAILMGRVGIAGFDLAEVLAGCNSSTESSAGMTECAGLISTFLNEGSALTMQRFLPIGFLATDEGCVIMALSTSQVCC